MTAAYATNPFLADTVFTASPERLLVMLYDRLALDLRRAEAAIDGRDPAEAHERLTNAQEIVATLRSALDVEVWPQGAGLLSVYDYLLRLLVDANVEKNATKVAEARGLVAPLHEAWTQAAGITAGIDVG
jgi:flagellar protein FliS